MSESAYKSFIIADQSLKSLGSGSLNLDKANDPRQVFQKTYMANGYVDIIKTSLVKEKGIIHGHKVMPFLTPVTYEVDTLDDFRFLEYLIHNENREYNLLFGATQNA